MQPKSGPRKEIGLNPLTFLFGKVWQHSAGNRQNIVYYWLLFIAANLVSLVLQPLAMAKFWDILQSKNFFVTTATLWQFIGILALTIILGFAFWAFHGPGRLLERRNAFGIKANYRNYLLNGVMGLPLEWHNTHHSGDTIDKMEKGTSALYGFSESSYSVVSSIVELLISLAALAYYCGWAVGTVVLMILVTVWTMRQFDRRIVQQYEELNHLENQISESIYDGISTIETVVTLGISARILASIAARIQKPWSVFRKNIILNESKWALTDFFCKITMAGVMGIYLLQHLNSPKAIVAGDFYLLMNYLGKITELFFRFTDTYANLLQKQSGLMNSEELALDFAFRPSTAKKLSAAWQELRIAHLNFSYKTEDGIRQHIKDLDLTIRRGERIAFIGSSGSGKSTVLKLMKSLLEPDTVHVTADGVRIAEGFRGISEDTTLIPQLPQIFAGLLGENLMPGIDCDPPTLRSFTDLACFTEILDRTGLDFYVQEGGANLSGGERQRLALARGLLAAKGKDILLLDEPTSSLDARNEWQVYRNIMTAFTGTTVISAIHSLELLPLFDRVCYFHNGAIVAEGRNLEEIVGKCPHARSFCRHAPLSLAANS